MAELSEDTRLVEGRYYGVLIESPSSIVTTAVKHHLAARGLDSNDLPPESRGAVGWQSIWLVKVRTAMSVLAAKNNVTFAVSEGAGVRLRDSWIHVYPSRYEDPTIGESLSEGFGGFGSAIGTAVTSYLVVSLVLGAVAIYFLGPELIKRL